MSLPVWLPLKNNLNNQVYEYTKRKVKTSEDWWKAFLKSDIAKGQKLTDPAVFNKNILQNIAANRYRFNCNNVDRSSWAEKSA